MTQPSRTEPATPAEERTMLRTSKATYQVRLPETPGSQPRVAARGLTLAQARRECDSYDIQERRDLTYQDVRIERADGRLYEYAGPMR